MDNNADYVPPPEYSVSFEFAVGPNSTITNEASDITIPEGSQNTTISTGASNIMTPARITDTGELLSTAKNNNHSITQTKIESFSFQWPVISWINSVINCILVSESSFQICLIK